MTAVVPTRVCIGHGRVRAPGFASMDDRSDADIHYRAGDAFPFVDRTLEAIVVAGLPSRVHEAALLALLLECRRTLRARGGLRVVVERSGSTMRDEHVVALVRRAASMAGLAEAPADGAASSAILVDFAKPDRLARPGALVSIAIPAYHVRFFAAALRSALTQTYAHTEIVVSDDSEGDAIERIVCELDRGGRVRYFRNPTRLRSRRNYGRCLELSRGEFVKFLNDDDELDPRCVERLVAPFFAVPDLTLATSHRWRIDAVGRTLDDEPATTPIVVRDCIVSGTSLANAMLMAGVNVIGEPSTTLFRARDLADQAPAYFAFHGREGRGAIDMTTWTALLVKGDAAFIAERLSRFRIHDGQQQRDPATVARSTMAVRGLQSEWLSLGLDRRTQADRLAVKPLPFDASVDWELVPVRVTASAASPALSNGGVAAAG